MRRLRVLVAVLTVAAMTVMSAEVARGEQGKREATKVEKLAAEIRRHDKLYWQGKPEISDAEYDKLKQQLAKLAPTHPLIQKIGELKLSGDDTVKHPKAMLSLKKVYSEEALLDWVKAVSRTPQEVLQVQPKYDGIAADYTNGVLSTRGDGETGYNISRLLPLIQMKKAPDTPADFRGELILDDASFKSLNKQRRDVGKNRYQTARTAVVSCLKNEQAEGLEVKLTLVDYRYISHTCQAGVFGKRWPLLYGKIRELPYPMDGIVIKLADRKYAASLGATEHHPRSMIAYKFKSQSKPSVIKSVQWQFADQGLVPVAELEPVLINARTISRATLYNAGYLKKNGIHVGDQVTVSLTGDSIPEIVSVSPGTSRRNALIEHCPECGRKLVFEGPQLRCKNAACAGVRYAQIRKQLQKNRIRGLGDKTLYKLVKVCQVKSVDDLYALSQQQLASVPGIGEKRARQLYSELQKR